MEYPRPRDHFDVWIVCKGETLRESVDGGIARIAPTDTCHCFMQCAWEPGAASD